MKVKCQKCSGNIEAGEEFCGQTVNCPHCDSLLVIPYVGKIVPALTPQESIAPSTENLIPREAPIRKNTPSAKRGNWIWIAVIAIIVGLVSFNHSFNEGYTIGATGVAWEKLQMINSEITSRTDVLPSEKLTWAAGEYAKASRDGVDRDLQIFIRDSVRVFRNVSDQLRPLDAEVAEAYGFASTMSDLGAIAGSTNNNYGPQGAQAGSALFGLLGEATAQEYIAKLQPSYNEIFNSSEVRELDQRAVKLRILMSRRYDREFVDLW